jgi:excisionase family DNA binding protein
VADAKAADLVEPGKGAVIWLLIGDMREELFAILRQTFEGKVFQERLAYSPDEAAKLLGISRELVHDLLRTGQLGSVAAGRRRLISKYHLEAFLTGDPGDSVWLRGDGRQGSTSSHARVPTAYRRRR